MVESSSPHPGNNPGHFASRQLPFVGRRQQLSALEHGVEEALAGQPQVVLISGEAGIGKTRLLQEVRTLALQHGMHVWYGRYREDLALSYLPFVEAILVHLEHVPESLKVFLDPEITVIKEFLRPNSRRALHHGTTRLEQGDQERLRLLVAVAEVIISLAQSCPALLIVDDLHWADSPSLELLGHLVYTVSDRALQQPLPLLMLGTYRSETPGPRLSRLVDRLQREEICHRIELTGLGESDMYKLLLHLGLKRPSHQLVGTLNTLTRGNPLFIQEAVHRLQAQNALQERGGYIVALASAVDLSLPDHVTSIIADRVAELSDTCREVLTLAAFLGDSFALADLAAITGHRQEALITLLEEGLQHHLLVNEAQGCQFVHPLVRRVFYGIPSIVRRQRLHHHIAQALEHLYAEHLEAHCLEIAHHLVRAGAAAEAAHVVAYARQAGDRAFAMFAWDEAAHYYEAALGVHGAETYLTPGDRAALHYRTGLAYHRDGDAGPCLDHYDKAITAYRLSGDRRGLAYVLVEKTRIHFTLATVPYGTMVDIQPLEDVLQELGTHDPGLRGSIYAVISEVYRTAMQTDNAMEAAQKALQIGQHTHDYRLCAYASFALGLVQAQELHLPQLLESWTAAHAYARQADDLWLQGWPQQRMPVYLMMQGRLHEAATVAEEAGAFSRRINDWGGYSVALSALTCVAVARGDFAGAEKYAQETLAMVYRSRYPWGGARALPALACAHALRGNWEAMDAALAMLLEPGQVFAEPGGVMRTFAEAFRLLRQAQSHQLDDVPAAFMLELMQRGQSSSYALGPFCAMVEIADLYGARDLVTPPCRALATVASQGVLFSSGWVGLLPRVLGVAEALQHHWDAAQTHFEAAIDVARTIGAQPELGRSYLDYGRMLASRGRLADRPQAMALAAQAEAIFADLGMRPYAEQVTQLTHSLRHPTSLGGQYMGSTPGRGRRSEDDIYLHAARAGSSFLG